MGIGFSSELETLRSEKERNNRNKDVVDHRLHQHRLDQEHTKHRANLERKRDRDKIKNTKKLLGDPLVRPFIQIVAEFLNEHTKHVKSTRERRETRFKEDRGNKKRPLPGGMNGQGMPPDPDDGRGPHRGGFPPDLHHPRTAGDKFPLPRPQPGHFNPNDDDYYDGIYDNVYGAGAGARYNAFRHHPPRHQQLPHHLHPPHGNHIYDRPTPHHPRRRHKPRDPDIDPRYTMHGGLGPGDEPFHPPERRPRGLRQNRGGYQQGRDYGSRARGARPERGGVGGGGSGSGFDEEGPGLEPGSGMEMGGGSNAGSENTYASGRGGRRGMPPGRGMRRGGGSQQ